MRNQILFCLSFWAAFYTCAFEKVYWPTEECLSKSIFVSEFNELCEMVHEKRFDIIIENLLTELHVTAHSFFYDMILRVRFQQIFGVQWRDEKYTPHGCYKVERPETSSAGVKSIAEYPECHRELVDYYKGTIPVSELKEYSAYIHHQISLQEYKSHYENASPEPLYPERITTENTTAVTQTTSESTTKTTHHTTTISESTTLPLTTSEKITSQNATSTTHGSTTPKIDVSTMLSKSETTDGSTAVSATATTTDKATTTTPSTTTTTSTTATKATTPMLTPPPEPIWCSVCNGTDCSRNPNVMQCAIGEYCLTQVKDDSFGNRELRKSCASEKYCYTEWWHKTILMPACFYVDNGPTSSDVHCTFCCSGDSCNSGRNVISTSLLQFDAAGSVQTGA